MSRTTPEGGYKGLLFADDDRRHTAPAPVTAGSTNSVSPVINDDAAGSLKKNVKVLAEFQDHGIPVLVFTLSLSPKNSEVGFPAGWQHTGATGYDLDQAAAGCAFGIIGGHGVDVVDVDPRNGGNTQDVHDQLLAFKVPIIAIVSTPGGGGHFYIPSTGRAKKINVAPGVDYIGGTSDGTGRGFVFAPGTSRPKYPNGRYTWVLVPQWELLGTGVEQARAFLDTFTTTTATAPVDGRTPEDLDEVLTVIARAEEGRRNTTLFNQTVKLASSNRVNEEVLDALVHAALACGLLVPEIESTINSALTTAGRQREAAHTWRDTVLASHVVRTSSSPALRFTIVVFADLFARFGELVGLSVRQLAAEISFATKAASEAINSLIDMGFLVRQPGHHHAREADSFSLAFPEPDEPEEIDRQGQVQEGNTPTASSPLSISIGTTDECYLFTPLLDRALEVHRHDAFTRQGSEVALPHGCAFTLAALEAGHTTIKAIVAATGQSKSTIRGHIKALSSADLIDYQQGSPIVPAWDDDVIDALDDWCTRKGIGPRAAQRRREHKVQQAAYELTQVTPLPVAGHSPGAGGVPLTFVSLVRDFDAASEKYGADIRAQAESQVERSIKSTSTPEGTTE